MVPKIREAEKAKRTSVREPSPTCEDLVLQLTAASAWCVVRQNNATSNSAVRRTAEQISVHQ